MVRIMKGAGERIDDFYADPITSAVSEHNRPVNSFHMQRKKEKVAYNGI